MNTSMSPSKNMPFTARSRPGPQRGPRLQDRRRAHDLPTRIGRARLVYLLGRSGSPLTDWLPLGLAAAVIGLMALAGPPGGGNQQVQLASSADSAASTWSSDTSTVSAAGPSGM
jgi:hypothetical protein